MISASSLTQLVNRIAGRISSTSYPVLEDDVISTLESNIDIVFPLLDTLINAAPKGIDEVDESTIQACCTLIGEVLGFIGYAIEQQRDWAKEFSVAFQEHLANTLFKPEINELIIQRVLDLLHQSDLTVIKAISEANTRLLESINEEDTEQQPLPELLEEMALISDSAYELYENLISQLHQIVPIDVQFVMIDEMLRTPSPLVHEAAVLMLLHPEKLIRQQVPQLLSHSPQVFTPTTLRRLIILRNWIPSDERAQVDALIRLMRLKKIDCETWPEGKVVKILATGFDGIGAQSLLVLSEYQEKFYLTGLLLKENGGIKEPILFKPQTEKESLHVLTEMTAQVPTIELECHYLDNAIPHFLAIGLQQGHPPSPLLLGFAELCGASHWRAESINESHMIRRLGDEIESNYFSHDTIDGILNNSKKWIENTTFAKTWIEQDAKVDKVLKEFIVPQQTSNEAASEMANVVCKEILTPRREKWQSRLLWMAIWAKASNGHDAPKWQEFFILAKLLHDGVPLDVIPLMQAISEETVECMLG